MINDKPVAAQLFEGWAKKYDQELLKDFYYQDDRKGASANVLVHESLERNVITLEAGTKIRLSPRESTSCSLRRKYIQSQKSTSLKPR
jgi:Vps16, C-terminal region